MCDMRSDSIVDVLLQIFTNIKQPVFWQRRQFAIQLIMQGIQKKSKRHNIVIDRTDFVFSPSTILCKPYKLFADGTQFSRPMLRHRCRSCVIPPVGLCRRLEFTLFISLPAAQPSKKLNSSGLVLDSTWPKYLPNTVSLLWHLHPFVVSTLCAILVLWLRITHEVTNQ